jgi:hypothetical protein
MKVIEFRNYLLQPGVRAKFIRYFEENFLHVLGEYGMPVLGHFEVENEPDRFVFIRGFPDMAERLRSLQRFYDGPYFGGRRDTVNAMIVDSDHCHLLRPLGPIGDLMAGPVSVYFDREQTDHAHALARLTTELTPNEFRHPVIQEPGLFVTLLHGRTENGDMLLRPAHSR